MFIRVVLAIFALAGVTAASAVSTCENDATLVCCKNAGDTNSGWQGSHCTKVSTASKCKYTALCCYDVVSLMSFPKCVITINSHTHRRDPLRERATRPVERYSASRCRGGCSALSSQFRLWAINCTLFFGR
ncbi:uncharacterized protein BJ212DRAFT_1409882 [Suillus subaureus]|uniref:Hydrophobin n=1 Tax=Suillus subaureus TaxID=48587 RepID=A0A9P7ASS2_9AGAM|nr:uncharacterized protein BJ212DRAFT_1409882 [Suillus subaureus]KAG1795851.1 hypothetical protein BJ212DRAFT_1409882 [Suillus subaureus]